MGIVYIQYDDMSIYIYILNVMEIYGHIWDIINFRFCNQQIICLI